MRAWMSGWMKAGLVPGWPDEPLAWKAAGHAGMEGSRTRFDLNCSCNLISLPGHVCVMTSGS